MKLFMVLYIFGEVAGNAGPLPYGLEECWARADRRQSHYLKVLMSKPSNQAFDGQRLTPLSIKHVCMMSATRPPLAERWK